MQNVIGDIKPALVALPWLKALMSVFATIKPNSCISSYVIFQVLSKLLKMIIEKTKKVLEERGPGP